MTMHSCTIGLAQFILPLPICHTISCSGCLFIFIIDYVLNGTKINSKQALGIFIGISGVLLVANDKIITKWFNPSY
jgi:drug/metabolite transporter (DMT)-like permease